MNVKTRQKEDDSSGRVNGRRNKFEIATAILEICSEGASKTTIVYQANLNFKTVNPYLNMLTKNGLLDLQKNGSSNVYKTTEKGAKLKKELNEIWAILS